MLTELLGFAPSRRSILDNPTLNLNDPSTWAAVFGDGKEAAAGICVNHERAMMIAAVWQAVGLISGALSRLPLDLYRRLPKVSDDAREKFAGHPVARLVRRRPNRETTAVKFWLRVWVHRLLWGNAYIFIDRDSTGMPIELLPLLPDRTRMKRIDKVLWCETEVAGKLEYTKAENIIHLEGLSMDNLQGADPLQYARDSWALALAQEQFASKFFKHGGRAGGILELPSGMPKPARDEVKEGFEKAYEGAENPFKTVILRENAKFHASQVSPQDSQMVEAGEAQVRQVARWFRLAPSKLGLSDSVSYNSKEEDNQSFLDDTLAPDLLQAEQECYAKLLTPDEQEELFFEYNTGALLKMNPKDRFQTYQIAIASRILSPNECRARENLLPYEGGDSYENPNTSKQGPADHPNDLPKQEAAPPEQPKPVRTAAELRLLFDLTGRARHKAHKSAAAFLEWIDGGIATMRAEWRKANTGAEPAFVEPFIQRMMKIAETAKADTLFVAVNEACQELEDE